MSFSVSKWLRICFINLLIVASLGIILRYKIAFSFPYLDQKHLLHGHSHFAFSGWLTQLIFVLMVEYLSTQSGINQFKKYNLLLVANSITAYGMLIAFPVQGYGLWSITFSTLSIFVSYIFAVKFWQDIIRLKRYAISHSWFKAALLFNVISSLGAFALAFMMVNKMAHQDWYLAAVYYFLHFQYNGWFFFAAMGLLFSIVDQQLLSDPKYKIIFRLFAASCIPAYFLSVLWMKIPAYVYWLVVFSSIGQAVGWIICIKLIIKCHYTTLSKLTTQVKRLFVLSAIALSVKLFLQLGSTHPALSQIAFGFRPIVIGYLHLVLLGVISIFLIGFTLSRELLVYKQSFATGLWIFVAGIIINETLLMVNGICSLTYTILPYINESLLAAALVMFTGILIVNINLRSKAM